jgi:hypothetical protein
VTTMPKLGIEASSPASTNEVPRWATSAGIKKATPLMNRKELDVTPTEISVIDQRAPRLNESVAVVSAGAQKARRTVLNMGAPGYEGAAETPLRRSSSSMFAAVPRRIRAAVFSADP